MARGTMIAMVVLSLGLLVAPGFAAESTATKAGTTATGEVTDSWLTFKTKLACWATSGSAVTR